MAVKARPVLVIEASEMKSYMPVPPNCWQGQVDCVVGPFSSQDAAQYFARAVVEFSQYDAFIDQLFPRGDAWYLKIGQARSESVGQPQQARRLKSVTA
jgi:hypothetical protein